MNKILLILSFLYSINCFSQDKIAQYGKITENGFYSAYISKTGDVINEGDTLVVGKPGGEFGFINILQGGQRVAPWLSGKKIKITQIKSYGTDKRGYTLLVQFKGYGLIPVYIDYDNALQSGEISNPKAKMTREQAIAKLKDAKELLDLQIISQAKYDSIKTRLSPIVMSKEK
jgi:hypothetical protein